MAHWILEADVPMMELPGETVFTLTAINPTSGAPVADVTLSNIVIYGRNVAGGGLVERIIPTLTPEEVEGLN